MPFHYTLSQSRRPWLESYKEVYSMFGHIVCCLLSVYYISSPKLLNRILIEFHIGYYESKNEITSGAHQFNIMTNLYETS